MIATLLLIAGLAAQGRLERVREDLAAGDYHSAWEALGGEPDELTRSRIRAEILYRAGDPAGALSAARAGLGLDPRQTDLLYYAAGAAVWLEDQPHALEYSARLLQAVDTLTGRGSEELREWQGAARNLAEDSEELAARQHELNHSLERLRLVALGGLASWLAALWLVLWRQGRSSRPVS